MKGAKMRVEPKTIHTADVDAFAISYQHKGSLKVAKSAFHSNHIILTLLIVTFFLKSKLCKTQTEKKTHTTKNGTKTQIQKCSQPRSSNETWSWKQYYQLNLL